MHRTNLKQLMTPYQLPQQQAGRGACLHVYPATCRLCRDRYALCIAHVDFDTQTFCRISLPTHKLYSHRFGLAALSLSGLGRRVSLSVWSQAQMTLALRGYMVLISINVVL